MGKLKFSIFLGHMEVLIFYLWILAKLVALLLDLQSLDPSFF